MLSEGWTAESRLVSPSRCVAPPIDVLTRSHPGLIGISGPSGVARLVESGSLMSFGLLPDQLDKFVQLKRMPGLSRQAKITRMGRRVAVSIWETRRVHVQGSSNQTLSASIKARRAANRRPHTFHPGLIGHATARSRFLAPTFQVRVEARLVGVCHPGGLPRHGLFSSSGPSWTPAASRTHASWASHSAQNSCTRNYRVPPSEHQYFVRSPRPSTGGLGRDPPEYVIILEIAVVTTKIYERLKTIPAESGPIQSCRNPVQTPYGWTDYIYHVGSIWDYRSVVDAGLITEENGNKQGRQTCFFAANNQSIVYTFPPLIVHLKKESLVCFHTCSSGRKCSMRSIGSA